MAKEGPATLDDLLKQAKTTNRLLAAQLKAQMSQMDVIRLLSDLGLTAREIGELLERLLDTTQDMFILQALEAGMAVHPVKTLLGVSTDRVTRVSKLVPKRSRKNAAEQ